MKVCLTGLVALLIFTTHAFCQKSPIKYGDISMDEMKMTIYPRDSSAEAVVLADYGIAYISVTAISASLVFERHTRIKILRQGGTRWADVQVPVFQSGSSEEQVGSLKATTYNLEGGKIVATKMSKDAVLKEKFNRNFNIQKFSLPGVKEGSVIEYAYKIHSDFLTNFPNWEFQRTIPVMHSEYWAVIPEFFIFEKYMQGYVGVTSYDVKNQPNADYVNNAHHWICKNVPAFKEEPFMTCEQDYLSRINIALSHVNFPGQPMREIMGSWKTLNERLLESERFGAIINSSGFLRKQAEEITKGMTDPLQKTTAIFNYVRSTLEWDGVRDYVADSPKKVFDSKKGSAGDINIALASMLDKADLPVEMIVLSTRDHGFIRQSYPMERQFNYVICAVRIGDKTIFLDATERMLPMGVLPERCLNGDGMVVSKLNHRWINIVPGAKAKSYVSADLTLGAAGEMKGKLAFYKDGYDGLDMRKAYASQGEEEFLKSFLGTRLWDIEKTSFEDVKEFNKSVKQTHELTINEHASVAGDVMYINPFVFPQVDSNPFKSEQREYPVDFGKLIEKTYVCKIAVPDGFMVDELPKSKILALAGNAAKYSYSAVQMGNSINITSTFLINKSLFVQNEYPDLREFYSQVVAKQAEQIVVKKK